MLGGLDEVQGQPSEQLSVLDKAAALAEEAAQKQFEQKHAPMFAFKGELLMSAAEIASHVANVDAALGRLKEAASALDAAARADKTRATGAALNGAAVYAMVAALEANRVKRRGGGRSASTRSPAPRGSESVASERPIRTRATTAHSRCSRRAANRENTGESGRSMNASFFTSAFLAFVLTLASLVVWG
jgi:hypothetical protein